MNSTLCTEKTVDPAFPQLAKTGIPHAQIKARWEPVSASKFDTNRFVGRRIRILRIQANMSQQALADHCCVYRTYISRIENGEANPTVNVLAVLARNLKAEIGEFFVE